MSTPAPGWYEDPDRPDRLRYWNGDQWTEHRQANNPPPGSNSPTPAPPTTVPGENNGLAVAALVTGILGVLVAWIPFLGLFGFVMGILAFIFGILGINKVKNGRSSIGRGMATSGIVLGVVSLGLFLLATGSFIGMLGGDSDVTDAYRTISSSLEN